MKYLFVIFMCIQACSLPSLEPVTTSDEESGEVVVQDESLVSEAEEEVDEDSNSADNISTEVDAIEEEVVSDFEYDRVYISEVVTDPQQDHNESTPGNGIEFDSVPGEGTIGSTDEYVEIVNGTASSLNLTGWYLSMIDGTDEVQELTEDVSYFSQDGSLENFQSGEYLVIGNPDGAMNNTLVLELYNEIDEIQDSLSIEDANAESLNDESYRLSSDGFWEMSEATPGY